MPLALGTCFEEAYRPIEWSIDLLLRKMLPSINMEITVRTRTRKVTREVCEVDVSALGPGRLKSRG